jgi:fructose-specific phosphotransferase system IIA component
MRVSELLSEDRILLDLDASTKEEVWSAMASVLNEAGVVTDLEAYLKDVEAREKMGTTGVGHGVAIPHAKSSAVKSPGLAMARTKKGIDVSSLDGSLADIFFLIAAPLDADKVYLQALSKLARLLMHDSFRDGLRSAGEPKEILRVIASLEEEIDK